MCLSVKISHGASVTLSILSIYSPRNNHVSMQSTKNWSYIICFPPGSRDPHLKEALKLPLLQGASAGALLKAPPGFSKEGRSFFLEAAGTGQAHGEDGSRAAWLRGGMRSWEHWETLVLTWTVLGRILRWNQRCILSPLFLWHPWQSCTPCQL